MPRGRPKRKAENDSNEEPAKVKKVEKVEEEVEEEEEKRPPPPPFTNYFLEEEENKQLAELRSNWRFLVVLHFCEHFKEHLIEIPSFTTQELERDFLSNKPVLTIELILGLLKNLRAPKTITKETYLRTLKNIINRNIYDFPEGNPLKTEEDIEFHELPLNTKVKILHCLCEYILEDKAEIKEKLLEWQSDEQKVRPLPIGWDRFNNSFWRFGSISEELFVEKQMDQKKKTPTGGQWKIVCNSVEGWETLAEQLQNSTHTDEKEFHSFLTEELIPPLIENKKKMERKQKKQHRAAISMSNIIDRPRRSTRQVSYNYNYFDHILE